MTVVDMFKIEGTTPDRKVTSSTTKPCGKHLTHSHHHKNTHLAKCLFAKYDKCDSLLLFPASFASCLNSGDFGGLSRLIKSRMSEQSELTVFGHQMNVATAVRVFELLDELHPDRVYSCQKTKRVDSEIDSVLSFKYTACKAIAHSLKMSVQDPSTLSLCPEPQSNPAVLLDFIASKPAEDRVALLTQVYTADELLVRGMALMSMEIDTFTKKITHLTITCHFTSFDAV